MKIIVKYQNGSVKYFDTFKKITRRSTIVEIDCSHNNLKTLPKTFVFHNLIKFVCAYNKLKFLPKMVCPQFNTLLLLY